MGTLDVYTESQILVRTENRRPQNVSNFTWRVLKEQMATSARSGGSLDFAYFEACNVVNHMFLVLKSWCVCCCIFKKEMSAPVVSWVFSLYWCSLVGTLDGACLLGFQPAVKISSSSSFFFKKKLEFYMLASVTVGGESSTEFWKNHGWLKNILTLDAEYKRTACTTQSSSWWQSITCK